MRPSLRLSLAAGLASVLASIALLPAFERRSWFWIAALAAFAVTLGGWGLRRLRVPRAAVPAIQVAAGWWAFLVLCAQPKMHWHVIPGAAAVELLATRFQTGMGIINDYAAPLPHDPDLSVTVVLGVAVVAFLVDVLAVTVSAVAWAGLPLLAVYADVAATLPGSLPIWAFLPVAAGYLLLLAAENLDRVARWGRVLGAVGSAGREPRATALGQTGRRVGVAVLGIAVVIPALLPAMSARVLGHGDGIGNGFGGGHTVTITNPMVQTRRDLQLPQDFPLFSYTSSTIAPNYLQLVVLDDFNGAQWRASPPDVSAAHKADGPLPTPAGLASSVERSTTTYDFSITSALQSRWLPAPYPAKSVKVQGDWRYDATGRDIIGVGTNTAGLHYQVTSLSLGMTVKQLRDAPPAPARIQQTYTRVPSNLPAVIRQDAAKVTKGAKTNYDRAVALQQWFRSSFDYSLATAPGDGTQATVDFLRDRSGYCEQFASTMALMARLLGIPAVVAVGYMPGILQEDGSWLVSTHDAHAWPELYFSGVGWVRFEPTPAVQTGAAPAWTDPQTVIGDPYADLPGQNAPSVAVQHLNETAPRNTAGAAGPAPATPWQQQAVPVVVIVAAVLLGLGLPFLIRSAIRRHRLRKRAGPAAIEAAWREVADTSVDLGLPWSEAATPRVLGARLRGIAGDYSAEAGRLAVDLARLVERSRYARDVPAAPDAAEDARVVCAALRRSVSRRRRLLAAVLPPTLWRPVRGAAAGLGGLRDRTADRAAGWLGRSRGQRRSAATPA